MRVFIMMVCLVVCGPLIGLATGPDDASDLRLVIVAPWHNAQRVVRMSGGNVIGPDRALFAVLAQTDDVPAFAAAARAAGALAVLNGKTVAILCGVSV
ncbi:hypothetical protein [uncultured Tateyamaria sp.]|uniref:hypothetical protein n=1 Tax=uncultured Tateyamaria sp. TaxID=455651 RepID=UPI002624FE5D|nr:hypothetical protein [uncultured Tateyamaria sp.]